MQTTEILKNRAEENRQLVDRINIATESAGICSWELDLVARRYLWLENPIEALTYREHPDNLDVEHIEELVLPRGPALISRYRSRQRLPKERPYQHALPRARRGRRNGARAKLRPNHPR